MEICSYNGNIGTESKLAEYSTREKAIKVLDMIQDAYISETEVSYGEIACRVMPRNIMFQMPQNEEVEV